MKDSNTDKFSAVEPGLGYLYQSRLALLRLLELPDDIARRTLLRGVPVRPQSTRTEPHLLPVLRHPTNVRLASDMEVR